MLARTWVATVLILISGAISQTPELGELLASQKNLTTFYALIQKYPDILLQLPSYSGVTILAPNNDAFSKIPYSSLSTAFKDNDQEVITNVLEYHILQGTEYASQLVPGTPVFYPTLLTSNAYTNVTGGQRVENVAQAGDLVVFVSGLGSRSTLTQADLKFNGGVVQVIDTLLIPPENLTVTLSTFNLTSFEGALYKADIVEKLTETANVTIFAAADEAFQNLGSAITDMTAEQLAAVVDYTWLPQVVYSTGLTNGTKFATSTGENITIRHDGNTAYVNAAQILTTDILIANGVVHVIDNVLNPQGPYAVPNPQLPTQVPAFASATPVGNLPFTSALPCTVDCPVSSKTSSTGSQSQTSTASGAQNAGSGSTSSVLTSSSRALGVGVARETGLGAAGFVLAIAGAAIIL